MGFNSDQEAKAALNHYNGAFIDTLRVTVEYAAPVSRNVRGAVRGTHS